MKTYKTVETLEDMTQEGLSLIRAGVDIATAKSARESVRVFKQELPEVYSKFYTYFAGGVDTMGTITFTQEDYQKVKCPFIPVQMRFEYQILEHLYHYELSFDPEVQSRSASLFEFIKGFEEVVEGVFIKLCGLYVYLIDINAGTILKRKFLELKRVTGYIRVKEGKADILIRGNVIKLYHAGGTLWGSGLWEHVGTKRQKKYVSFVVSGIGCFRVHTVIMALRYGIEVAKFLIGSNSLLTVEHMDGDGGNNKISNLCIYTRKSNQIMSKKPSHKAQDFCEIFEEVFISNTRYFLV